MEKGKLIYETDPEHGFVFKAWKIIDSIEDAFIEVYRDNKLIKEFTFPLYKVYNISAHSHDIVQSELNKDVDGYMAAGSDGLGGNVFGKGPSET